MDKPLKVFKINYHVGKSIHGPSDFDNIICHYTIEDAFNVIRASRDKCIETCNDPDLKINNWCEIDLYPGLILD